MADEPKTKFPPDPQLITQTLTQNKTWHDTPIWDMDLSHLKNVVGWLDRQVEYVLNTLGKDTSQLTDEAMNRWLHGTPLLRAMDAAVIGKERDAAEATPKAIEPVGWMLKPMAAFDIETTGLDIETERIVAFAFGTAKEPGDWKSVTMIVNPGIDVPAEATMIHGITDDQAKEGTDAATSIATLHTTLASAARSNLPVIGHNLRYDLSILDRECRRHLGKELVVGPVLDTFVIDRGIDKYRRGKRTLEAVCEHYGVGRMINHSADEDAMRSLRLLWQIMISPTAYEFFNGTLPGLEDMQTLQQGWYVEQQKHMAEWKAKQGEEYVEPDTSWPIAEKEDSPPW